MRHDPTFSATTPARAALRRITVRDFRNLEHIDLDPPAEGFALLGDNGQGKTNLLEALYYLALLRSFRGAHDAELIRFGAPGFHVAGEMEESRAREITIGFQRAGKRKKVAIDGGVPPRFSDALGALPVVIFSPRDLELVAGPPSERRRFLDVVLSLTSRRYLSALQRYRGALAQRNAALRAPGAKPGDPRIAVWEPVLAESGALLWSERHRWHAEHAARYVELCESIGERGTAAMTLSGGLVRHSVPLRDAERHLAGELERLRGIELSRGATLAGPHRDDVCLLLDGHDLRTYGSAGQQRTAAIALRLLEAATLRVHAGAEPVVLLDDPFAELDVRRAGRILELLGTEGRGQTILAVPREHEIPAGLTRLRRWRIVAGSLAADSS